MAKRSSFENEEATIMAFLGKINLAEVAPNHPFVGRSILIIPKPPLPSNSGTDSSKQEEGIKLSVPSNGDSK
jgi:hypothetical protein